MYIETTSSISGKDFSNPQTTIGRTIMYPPNPYSTDIVEMSINKIGLYTLIGDYKTWVEGSTFELWGVRK